MASIQIRAGLVLEACKKYMINFGVSIDKDIERIDTSYLTNKDFARNEIRSKAIYDIEFCDKIRKIAEYSIKPEKQGDMLKSNSDSMISIDHNDFSLIGEYLTSTEDK